jgi:hypothetical protein
LGLGAVLKLLGLEVFVSHRDAPKRAAWTAYMRA